MPRFGRNIISAGPVIMIVGFGLLLVTVEDFGGDLTPWELIPSLVIGGIGMGCVVASVYPFILAEVPIKDAGSASGVISAVGQIGGAIGIAAIGVIFFGLLGGQADDERGSVRAELTADLDRRRAASGRRAAGHSAFETCFHDRAVAKDFSVPPESCQQAEAAQSAFAAADPALAAKVGATVAVHADEAKQRNFSAAIERTLIWEIGGAGMHVPAELPAAGEAAARGRARRGGCCGMSQRRVSNPLALAVLACLAEKPMHPYEIASTLRDRHKDESIKLNYGSLYSVIEALCRNQLIAAQETIREGKRPERTVFELTEAGSVELNDWLSELLARPAKEYTQFEAGLSLMPVLPPKVATHLLRQRCELLEVEVANARAVEERVRKRNVPRLFLIEREYWRIQREAELAWVRQIAEEIDAGRLEGVDQWQSWHLTDDCE